MNIAEIKSNSYKVFARQGEENRAHNVIALQYIEDLASKAGINIYTWDLVELFKDKTKRSTHFIRDRKEINRIFFEYYEVYKATIGDRLAKAEREMRSTVKNGINRRKEELIAEKTRILKDWQNAAVIKHKEAEDRIARAWSTHNEILAIEGNDTNIVEDIMQVITEGFYELHSFDGVFVKLATKTDLILTEVNKSAGINRRVNLGRLLITISIVDYKIGVFPLERNIIVNNHVHPYVSGVGGVCWGTASGQWEKLHKEFKTKEILNLLASILQNYVSDSTPWCALETFEAKAAHDKRPDLAAIVAKKAASGITEPESDEDAPELVQTIPAPNSVPPQGIMGLTNEELHALLRPMQADTAQFTQVITQPERWV